MNKHFSMLNIVVVPMTRRLIPPTNLSVYKFMACKCMHLVEILRPIETFWMIEGIQFLYLISLILFLIVGNLIRKEKVFDHLFHCGYCLNHRRWMNEIDNQITIASIIIGKQNLNSQTLSLEFQYFSQIRPKLFEENLLRSTPSPNQKQVFFYEKLIFIWILRNLKWIKIE